MTTRLMTMSPLYLCGKPCSRGTHNETVKNLALFCSIINGIMMESRLRMSVPWECFQYTITLKMAAKNFLPRCIAFYNRIPIDSLAIPNSNAMHLGKKFLAAIFSVIVYSSIESKILSPLHPHNSNSQISQSDWY